MQFSRIYSIKAFTNKEVYYENRAEILLCVDILFTWHYLLPDY